MNGTQIGKQENKQQILTLPKQNSESNLPIQKTNLQRTSSSQDVLKFKSYKNSISGKSSKMIDLGMWKGRPHSKFNIKYTKNGDQYFFFDWLIQDERLLQLASIVIDGKLPMGVLYKQIYIPFTNYKDKGKIQNYFKSIQFEQNGILLSKIFIKKDFQQNQIIFQLLLEQIFQNVQILRFFKVSISLESLKILMTKLKSGFPSIKLLIFQRCHLDQSHYKIINKYVDTQLKILGLVLIQNKSKFVSIQSKTYFHIYEQFQVKNQQ